MKDVLRVGDPDAPPLGTLDPDLLHYLAISQRLLITSNRKRMPAHLQAYWATGGHLWGLFWVRPGTPVGRLAREIFFVWAVSEAEEWVDRLDWLPF